MTYLFRAQGKLIKVEENQGGVELLIDTCECIIPSFQFLDAHPDLIGKVKLKKHPGTLTKKEGDFVEEYEIDLDDKRRKKKDQEGSYLGYSDFHFVLLPEGVAQPDFSILLEEYGRFIKRIDGDHTRRLVSFKKYGPEFVRVLEGALRQGSNRYDLLRLVNSENNQNPIIYLHPKGKPSNNLKKHLKIDFEKDKYPICKFPDTLLNLFII